MPTAIIQIGNSDDKLTQIQWSSFVYAIRHEAILKHCKQIHFAGAPGNAERWQNFCFVVECALEQIVPLKESLTDIRKLFDQDSVAITIGETEFV